MTKFAIEHGIRVGDKITATIKGRGVIHLGDQLAYPNGKSVSVCGIGSGRVIAGTIEVLLSGDFDEEQNTIYAE